MNIYLTYNINTHYMQICSICTHRCNAYIFSIALIFMLIYMTCVGDDVCVYI